MPKPRTRTSLSPDRSSNMVGFYGLERRKMLAKLSRILAASKRRALERLHVALPVSDQRKIAYRWGTQAQLVEDLHHRGRPTPVPKRIEVIEGRLDVRESRPTFIQTSSAVTNRSAIPELRVRLSPLPLDWQANSEPKSTMSRTVGPPVNTQTASWCSGLPSAKIVCRSPH